MIPPVLVSYAVTRKCNLKCIHCYSEAIETPHPNELSTEEAKELISDIARLGVRMIIFDGGEPTLRDDLPVLIKHAYDEGLSPLVGSNGMDETLSKSYLTRLKKSGVKVIAISLDGASPETHDMFRGVKGAWEKTIRGIRNCRDVGVPFQIGIAVHRKNINEFHNIVELSKKLGASAIEVFDFVATGRGKQYQEYELTKEQRVELVKYIIKRQITEDDLYFRVIAIPQFWVEVEENVEDEELLLKFTRTCCTAGIRYATILYDGTVYPCMLLPIPIGNVRERPFSEIWKKSELLEKLRSRQYLEGRCKICKYKDVCMGARCKAFAKTGNIFAEDPTCWVVED